VIFADEPTGNLDSKSSGELLDLLRRSVDEFGQTVIMVTHDPTAASYAIGCSSSATGASSTTARRSPLRPSSTS
jgi:ABC-type lipoprotein export system ATPase subunit